MIMKKITSREWLRIGADYRSIINGQHYILEYDQQYGTCLVPVEIDDENGLEKNVYTFVEMFLTYRVNAYTEEEARTIAISSGHSPSLMKDFRCVRSMCDVSIATSLPKHTET